MIDFDLRDTLQAVLDTGRAEGERNGVGLVARMQKGVPTALSGDEHRLRRSLHLLLGHAVATAGESEGDVDLKISADVLSEDEAVLHFEVRDASPALIPEDGSVPSFATLSADGNANLALWTHTAKCFAEELGVRSDPNEGNVYWFRVGVLLRSALSPQESSDEH
ncbi:MAG: hypothetical protein DHS20C15_16880 [Planctomycetota bacterium]|nr:MAG: hypothetical protein DHS20C15_16880 [Planctomycetota bacterium]